MEPLDLSSYPSSPGFKRAGTSEEAAKAIAPKAATLRDQVLAALKEHALTADECATYLRRSILSVRPRLSELEALHLIEDTGRRRMNISGKSAIVWRAK